ncbi:MAG: Amidohydrolase [Acidimicrobiales bacterium]|jgi:predicted TIM-barrel fold metal-dependent hydrolase|nr:Amidohydrolase [Acidimicrobiales bacterium]
MTVSDFMATTPIVDSDSHVTEPPDLWTSRVAKKWGDEVPHLELDEAIGEMRWRVGQTTLNEEAKFTMAGWRDFPPSHPPSLADADPAGWDPTARLERMDEYGMWAQVLYPNIIAFSTHAFLGMSDPKLALACVSAYNDFLAEFADCDRQRLIPIMMLPFWDVEASYAELERATDLGHKGVIFAAHFDKVGLPPIWHDHWSRLLSMVEERGLSVNFHIGFSDMTKAEQAERTEASGDDHARITSVAMLGNARAIADVICKGVCHRHPGLNFVSVESGAGWLLYLLESLDWHWKSYGGMRDRPELELPSVYFRRQVYGSFWFEEESLRRVIGALPDNIMFETDFPHPTSLSPGPASSSGNPRKMAEAALAGMDEKIVRKVFYETAARLYHLDVSSARALVTSADS